MSNIEKKFDNINDLIYYIENVKPNSRMTSSKKSPSSGWDNNCDFEKSMYYLKNGWQEGADILYKNIEFANLINKIDKTNYINYDVCGMYPFIPAAIAGNPENMIDNSYSTFSNNRIVKFVINSAYSTGINSQIIIDRGTAILSVIDLLESNNTGVEIEIVFSASNRFDCSKLNIIINLKKSNEFLDLSKLAFAICHPAFTRRIFFASMERVLQEKKDIDKYYRNYGYPVTFDLTNEPNIVYFDKINMNDLDLYENLEKTIKTINNMVKKSLNIDF